MSRARLGLRRDSLVTPVAAFFVFFSFFGVSFIWSSLTIQAPAVDIQALSTDIYVDVNRAIELNAPLLFELNPDIGREVPTSITSPVVVSTNNPTGYKLYAELNPDKTCLLHASVLPVDEDCGTVDANLNIGFNTSPTGTLDWNTWGVSMNGGANWLGFDAIDTIDLNVVAARAFCGLWSMPVDGPTSAINMDGCIYLQERYQTPSEDFLGWYAGLFQGIYPGKLPFPSDTNDMNAMFDWFVSSVNQFVNDGCDYYSSGIMWDRNPDYCRSYMPWSRATMIAAFNGLSMGLKTLLGSAGSNAANNQVDLTIATRVNMGVQAGSYRTTMRITALPEPAPEPYISGWSTAIGNDGDPSDEVPGGLAPLYGQYCNPSDWNAELEWFDHCNYIHSGVNFDYLSSVLSLVFDSGSHNGLKTVTACSVEDGTLTVVAGGTAVICDFYDTPIVWTISGDTVGGWPGWTSVWGTMARPDGNTSIPPGNDPTKWAFEPIGDWIGWDDGGGFVSSYDTYGSACSGSMTYDLAQDHNTFERCFRIVGYNLQYLDSLSVENMSTYDLDLLCDISGGTLTIFEGGDTAVCDYAATSTIDIPSNLWEICFLFTQWSSIEGDYGWWFSDSAWGQDCYGDGSGPVIWVTMPIGSWIGDGENTFEDLFGSYCSGSMNGGTNTYDYCMLLNGANFDELQAIYYFNVSESEEVCSLDSMNLHVIDPWTAVCDYLVMPPSLPSRMDEMCFITLDLFSTSGTWGYFFQTDLWDGACPPI